jgi:uncharacterized MAPEG superfamily protein
VIAVECHNKENNMSIALWCLMITGWLPIVCAGIAKSGGENFDNSQPREWLAKQQGYLGRANAAQHNSWEAFIWFGIAVLVAMVTNAEQAWIDNLSMIFVACRVLYIIFYLMDRPGPRTAAWLLGFFTTLTIFGSGA